ncbi:rhodanese-like domain-containing protein [Pseudomonas fluorescens]|uniref:rhodanese-like domain-containing protein n=1 Tax=Pseudomonas fluorescens TaxID=294 RepID=UPI0017847105|nr:rhodanese-like domain-containing protein [Pseudomonas fluorescens]
MIDTPHHIRTVEPEELRDLLEENDEVVVIDVRPAGEFALDSLEGSFNIPTYNFHIQLAEIPKETIIVTVCDFGGHRSWGAVETLKDLGFTRAVALKGGKAAWKN